MVGRVHVVTRSQEEKVKQNTGCGNWGVEGVCAPGSGRLAVKVGAAQGGSCGGEGNHNMAPFMLLR